MVGFKNLRTAKKQANQSQEPIWFERKHAAHLQWIQRSIGWNGLNTVRIALVQAQRAQEGNDGSQTSQRCARTENKAVQLFELRLE